MPKRSDPRPADLGPPRSGPSAAETHPEELRWRAAASALRRIDRDLARAPEEMQPVLRLIRSGLFDPGLNVRKMRRVLGLSNNFSTRFKKELGIGMRGYLEARRLECASRLLVDTRLDEREIAGLVGYRRLRTFNRAFERRMGSRPKEYRRSGGRLSRVAEVASSPQDVDEPSPGSLREEAAQGDVERLPPFVAGVARVALDRRCVRCGTALETERRLRIFERTTEQVGARLAESLEPMCDLCALEHAPRELLEPLFVQAVGRSEARREELDRVIEPENLMAGMRRQLAAEDAEVLIRALVLRYPRSAVVVSELLRAREAEHSRG